MSNRTNPNATVTEQQFGKVVPNDWPLKVPAKFMLAGKARDYWYIDNEANGIRGKAPVFCGEGAALKAIRRLYRRYGHLVTLGQCRHAFQSQKKDSERHAEEFHAAVAYDMAVGRARVHGGQVQAAELGTATPK